MNCRLKYRRVEMDIYEKYGLGPEAKAAIDNLESRRSIRKFRSEQVPDDIIAKICEAGTFAASGKNKQPATIIALTNPEDIAYFEAVNAEIVGNPGAHVFYGAPAVLVVLADPEISYTYMEDGSLVMGNLMNAAHALGVDSCWIHRAKQEFETERGKEILRELGLSETLVGIGNLVIGYRDCDYPEALPRKENYVKFCK